MSSPLRVRQVPAAHAYVQHLLPAADVGSSPVVHLPDPPVPGAPTGQWWPHPALEADWVRRHAREQDVLHLHFGTEGRSTAQLAAWLRAVRAAGLPLVYTVHDIDHPHLVDQTRHREHLALLVEAADGLLTLTEGAAAVVERDFGRRPLVVPHPHVAPLDRIGRRVTTDPGPLRVGVHLKSLRTNLAPMPLLPALVEATAVLRATGTMVELEVRAHPEVLDPAVTRHDPAVASWWRRLAGAPPPGVDLVLAPRLGDEELWDYLAALDVSVLPYAWGTHSGWVEACRDLGTWALTPDIGHLAEQGAGAVLIWNDQGMSQDLALPSRRLTGELVGLLARAVDGPPQGCTRARREDQRSQIAALHAGVYAAVVEGDRVDAAAAELV
ncbi:glycosyltransferase [Ornithinimicrobium pratense]|uniref:Glycosyltransferase family 4 protein n=1 Tax=Ornithinimicrobium pratense TaxID=2593973 RepID=A0A5J6V1G0_9MICO|nr:glycosyltransferase [Ornithinimicrobium pratense]QFG67405.1 glycosyltransferase family 4 protein [Ornithinimicrobium pratense]